jgi:hypothetical protein
MAAAQLWGSRNFEETPRRGEMVQLDEEGYYEVLGVMHHTGAQMPTFVTLFMRPLKRGEFPI